MPKPEIFIVGSVLSGTTLLRNILRQHSNLICPEETHIFRWETPFATEEYTDIYQNAETLKLHRKMDGVSENKFNEILNTSCDRKSFMQNYVSAFKQVHNHSTSRCFDKSPQNVYGMALIKAYFPNAKFIHIIRNPLNVAASIKRGHPGLSGNILGSINYWKESVMIVNTLKKVWHDDIYELKYEGLCKNPKNEIIKLIDFIEDQQENMDDAIGQIYQSVDTYQDVLDSSEINLLKIQLGELMNKYGY